jgi:hypothetical protein
MTMRIALLAGFALATMAVAPLGAQLPQRVNIGRAVASDVSITCQGPFAQLKVIAWAFDSVSVTGELTPGAQIENVFAGDPGVRPRGAKIYVRGPEGMVKQGTALEIRVPRGARVWVKGGTSEVSVTGVAGEVDVFLVGGVITVTGKPRTANIEAMDARVMFDGATDWLRIKTAAGNITARGNAVDAAFNTVTGNVHVEAMLERGRFESSSGSLTFAGSLARGASLTFDNHSGAIDVLLNPKADVSIYAFTLMGSIENLLTSRSASAPRGGRGQELELESAFGDGRVKIQSYKGTIRVGRAK